MCKCPDPICDLVQPLAYHSVVRCPICLDTYFAPNALLRPHSLIQGRYEFVEDTGMLDDPADEGLLLSSED
jgi:hypothetical protein